MDFGRRKSFSFFAEDRIKLSSWPTGVAHTPMHQYYARRPLSRVGGGRARAPEHFGRARRRRRGSSSSSRRHGATASHRHDRRVLALGVVSAARPYPVPSVPRCHLPLLGSDLVYAPL
ncbi:unnamed protein product [Urochloa humidicola]